MRIYRVYFLILRVASGVSGSACRFGPGRPPIRGTGRGGEREIRRPTDNTATGVGRPCGVVLPSPPMPPIRFHWRTGSPAGSCLALAPDAQHSGGAWCESGAGRARRRMAAVEARGLQAPDQRCSGLAGRGQRTQQQRPRECLVCKPSHRTCKAAGGRCRLRFLRHGRCPRHVDRALCALFCARPPRGRWADARTTESRRLSVTVMKKRRKRTRPGVAVTTPASL